MFELFILINKSDNLEAFSSIINDTEAIFQLFGSDFSIFDLNSEMLGLISKAKSF